RPRGDGRRRERPCGCETLQRPGRTLRNGPPARGLLLRRTAAGAYREDLSSRRAKLATAKAVASQPCLGALSSHRARRLGREFLRDLDIRSPRVGQKRYLRPRVRNDSRRRLELDAKRGDPLFELVEVLHIEAEMIDGASLRRRGCPHRG